MTTTTDTPKVWIGCLASYNAGRLIGEWVDAIDADEMSECQERVAAAALDAAKKAGDYPVYFGPPEEFFIADYDGFPSSVVSTLGEYASYEKVAEIGAALEDEGEAFAAWLDSLDTLDDFDPADFHNHYRGEWDSEEAYAQEYVSDCGWGDVPAGNLSAGWGPRGEVEVNAIESLFSYLDWDSITRELFQHGNYTSWPAGGGVYVFEDEV